MLWSEQVLPVNGHARHISRIFYPSELSTNTELDVVFVQALIDDVAIDFYLRNYKAGYLLYNFFPIKFL